MFIVTTEAYFTGIKEKLLSEIGLAKQSIYIAVAWFTDRDLFAALLARQQSGVKIALAVTNDEINSKIAYESLAIAGGEFYRVDGALMHNKFCVLDGRDVVTGSYNWTYRAASENYENIVITAGDYDLAYRYISEFKRITGSVGVATDTNVDLGKVVRRLQVVRSLVQLDEREDALRQTRRLCTEWNDPLAEQLLTHLEAGSYTLAVEMVDEFVQAQSRVQVYEDPILAALRLEIRDLEYRIVAVESETSEAEKLLSEYNHAFTVRLGTLAEEILRLKKEYAYTHRQESQYSQQEYDEAQRRYEEFRQEREAEAMQPFFELDASGREQLKKLHRQCVMLCHPDKVADELKDAATDIFRQVQECYERQDLTQLTTLAQQLAQGQFRAAADTSRIDVLQARRNRLQQQLAVLVKHLANLRQGDAFQQISVITDMEEHFKALHTQLSEELTRWQSYAAQSEPA
ncbi:hypothetical protein FY528_19440 [Hymenobacter lutimineralis]|uniref:phospholipase D n=1 Tax=Hymenobacter lutimineralis TaxID=2606448 RepID=A0A5D6UTY3_9BACT|nr:phospholipase D-like domain-containing protein [Hymenobacter lutimineralis]TYZ06102.1 hypothetical protein FY528_19440 [Hymenobacter lutimineralis]